MRAGSSSIIATGPRCRATKLSSSRDTSGRAAWGRARTSPSARTTTGRSTPPTAPAASPSSRLRAIRKGRAGDRYRVRRGRRGDGEQPGRQRLRRRALHHCGVADTGFDGDGYASINFNGGSENAWAIGTRPDGRIVVGGTGADQLFTLLAMTSRSPSSIPTARSTPASTAPAAHAERHPHQFRSDHRSVDST